MNKKLFAIMMSAVLACALCPGLAVAAPLETGSGTLDTQAAKTSVYVLTKVKRSGDSLSDNMLSGRFKYGSNYLLKQYVPAEDVGVSYKYSGTKIKQMKQGTSTTKVSTAKNGKIKKTTWKMPGSSTYSIVDAMTYASGRVKSYTETLKAAPRFGDGYVNKYKYSYGSNGKVSKIKAKGTWTNETKSYKYDDNKNLTTEKYVIRYSGSSITKTYKYDNTYDADGNLAKRVVSSSEKQDDSATYEYTYKKVQVSKSVASKVKEQQWALANLNLNFAIGVGTKLMY